MCERLVIPGRVEVEQDLSVLNPWWSFETRFNVAVTHKVPVARVHDRESEGVMMRWGLVPAATRTAQRQTSAGPAPTGSAAIGPGIARVDSTDIGESLELRSVWMCGQRCIVPLAGFYMWQLDGRGHRQPHYVRVVNRPVFGVAALWDRFVTDEDDVIEGCALVSVRANPLLQELGGSVTRMPAILNRDAYETWLGGRPAQALDLLQSYPAERMVRHAVGPRVNVLEYDDSSLIRPIAATG